MAESSAEGEYNWASNSTAPGHDGQQQPDSPKLILPPPHPAPVAFHQWIQDPTSSHARDLSDANAARARVRTTLKATRKEGAKEGGDWAAALKATTEYLPYLYAVLACIEADDLHLQTEPSFTWRSTLSTQLLKKSQPRITLPSLHYELSATLLTHALCLSNHASTLVASLGSYETSSSVTTAALKSHDGTVNSAAELLCCSSGVLTYLAETVIPRWEAAVGEGVKGRPVELTRDVVTALSKLALADANLLAIRRLLSRSLASSHSNTTPGPPLSSSHPSPSLLAKLHLNVFNLYDSARSLCKTASRLSDASGEMHPDLRRYLSDGRTIALSLSYKWLGVDAGENGGREKAGEAVAWLGMAKASLEEMGGKGAGLKSRMGMGKVGGKERKGKVAQEVDSIGAFLSAYRKVNDTVHFQPVPLPATLQPLIPAGRAALAPKPFLPPPPAFRLQLRDGLIVVPPPVQPELDASGLDLDDSSDEEGGGKEGSYFGSGSYW